MSRNVFVLTAILTIASVAATIAQTPATAPGAASAPAKPTRILQKNPTYTPPPPTPQHSIKGEWFEVTEAVYNWGDAWEGDQVTHEFIIKNTSPDKSLEVRDVRPECHCTKANAEPRIIAPGGTGKASFVFNSTGMQKFIQKGATITTNDPKQTSFRCLMQGNVKTVVTLDPVGGGSFGQMIDPNEPVASEMELTSNVDEPLLMQPMPTQAKSQPFAVQVDEITKGKKWKITAKTVNPLPAGYLSSRFIFKLGHPKKQFWEFNITGFRPERISAMPVSLMFPEYYAGNPPLQVAINNYGTTPVKVLSATIVGDDKLKATVVESAGTYRIDVTGPARYILPDKRDMIVKTDDKEIPEIKVTIYQPKMQAPNLPPIANKPAAPAAPGGTTGGSAPTSPVKLIGPASQPAGTPVKPMQQVP